MRFKCGTSFAARVERMNQRIAWRAEIERQRLERYKRDSRARDLENNWS